MYIKGFSETFELESRLCMSSGEFDFWFKHIDFYVEVIPLTDKDKSLCLLFEGKYYVAMWHSTVFHTVGCKGHRVRSVVDDEVEALKNAEQLWFTIRNGSMFITDTESDLCL